MKTNLFPDTIFNEFDRLEFSYDRISSWQTQANKGNENFRLNIQFLLI
jgi:hypothetical protein